MKSEIKNVAIVLIFLLFGKIGLSQENYASNISKSVADDEKLLVAYDIESADGAKSFTVVLFLTYEGNQVKATSAYGDVGTNVSPGREKAIVWYYKDDFDGNIENVKVEVFAYKENEPQAIFKIASIGNNGYAPCEVVFTNNSSYANEYQWNFGDTNSGARNLSFEKDSKHTYEKGGVYSISLTARNTQLRRENTYYQSIEIKTHDPVTAGFEIEGNHQLPPAKVKFINTSVNADSYQWNFGDPSGGRKNESTKDNAKFKYKNAGTYKVQLVGKNHFSGLTDTIIKEVVVEQERVAKAGFIYTKSSETAPSTVTLKNTSTDATDYEWNFGDPSSGDKNTSEETDAVHLFSKPGSYKVELSAWAKGAKKPDRFTEVVVIDDLPQPPEARFTIQNNNVIGPATIIFNNNSINATRFLWDFGDADSGDDSTSSKMNPSHTYQKAGRYKVVLTASSPGFSRESTATDWVVITAPATSLVDPEARFIIENNKIPNPAVVNFTDNSLHADSYLWNFGDEGSEENASELKNPVHIYSNAGRYKVTLTVKNENSEQTDTYTDFVEIISETKKEVVEKTVVVKKSPEPPVADFDITLNGEFVPVTANFKNLSSNADTYNWNFGDFDSDNNESSVLAPSHNYQLPGKYKITLEARNSSTGAAHQFSKEIFVKSNYTTYVNLDGMDRDGENALSFVNLPGNEYLVVVKNKGKGSSVLKFNNDGKIIGRKKSDFHISGITPVGLGNNFMMVGVDGTDKLFIQEIAANLKTGDPVFFQESKNFKTDFAYPRLALGATDEVGIVANTLNDRYPVDILFQKADKSGRIIPLVDRTFKYVGNKMFTDIVPTSDGGFALTGYWQEDKNSLLLILFAKIDRRGHGEIQLISSDMNILGCDIENSYQGGFAILRAEQARGNNSMYEVSFTLVDSEGGPTDCANLLPCSVKNEDILKYKPSMIKIDEGYVIASHGFNGVNYDITLYWIDTTGNALIRYETLRLPGDQFVMDIVRAEEGGYLIAGTQKENGNTQAIVIKTDPWGKLNQLARE